jgi:hypothetical protein
MRLRPPTLPRDPRPEQDRVSQSPLISPPPRPDPRRARTISLARRIWNETRKRDPGHRHRGWDRAVTRLPSSMLTQFTRQHHRHLLEVRADRGAAEPVYEFVLRGYGGEYTYTLLLVLVEGG